MAKNIKAKIVGLCALVCILSTAAACSGGTTGNSDSGSVLGSSVEMEAPPSFGSEEGEGSSDKNDDSSDTTGKEETTIRLITPAAGCEVAIASQSAIDYLNATDAATQLSILEAKKATGEVVQMVELSWKGNASDSYKVWVADNEDFANAMEFDVAGLITSIELYNLFPATTYYWKVQGTKEQDVSDVQSFTTADDTSVRFIYAGEPLNMRDVGGWKAGEATVNYGMIYRGGLLNGDDVPSIGRKSLTEEGIAIMRDQLGIRSEIDLRSDTVQTESHLGADTNFLHAGCDQYDRILNGSSTNAIKDVFNFLANKDNYPVYIHCNAGADRTGTLAFLINGLLGVSYNDLVKDFEITSLSYFGARYRSGVVDGAFDDTGVFQNDGGNYVAFGKLYNEIMENYAYAETDTLSQAIENFLIDFIGVDGMQIEALKGIMLSDYTPKQYEELNVAAQDILLENATASLSLGDYEYDGVLSVRYGKYVLGNDLSALDLSAIQSDENVYGERKVIVTVQKGEKTTELSVPVLFVTKEITNAEELKSAILYHNGGTEWGGIVVRGYYRLKNDIQDASLDMMSNIAPTDSWSHGTVGFVGTFDGNGKTITADSIGVGGMFGMLGNGAVVKNVTIKSAYNGVGTLLAAGCWGATLENVNFEIIGQDTLLGRPQSDWQGWITANFCGDTTFKNVTFNADGYTVDSLFGGTADGGYFTSNAFENCTLTADALGELGHTGGEVSKIFAKPVGLLATVGMQMEQTDVINLSKSQQYFYFDAGLAGATVVIKRDETHFVSGTLDSEGAIAFTPSEMFTLEEVGLHVLTVTAKTTSGDTYDVKFTIAAESGYKKVVVEDSVSREFLLSADDATLVSDTAALDLGEYAGGTVISIKLGTHDMGTDASALPLSGLVADSSCHGNQTITVLLQKDGNNYELNYSVLVVTKAFTNYTELCKAVMVGGSTNGLGKGAYYTMANDMNATWYHYWTDGTSDMWGGWGSAENAFMGTLDGRGHTISGGTADGAGLFGYLNGAVVKNINFNDITIGGDGANRSLIASYINNSTLENINITLVPNQVLTGSSGLIAIQAVNNSTVKNVTITANGCQLYSVFGNAGGENHNIGTTYENVVVTAKSMNMIHANATKCEGVTLVKKFDSSAAITTTGDATIVLGGTANEEVEVTGATTITKTLNENGDLVLTVADMAALFPTMGSSTITVKGATIDATVVVTASDSAELAAITQTQYLEVARDDGNPNMTLDLKDYAEYTLTKASLGGTELSISGNTLDLSSVTSYGAQTLTVYLEKGGVRYRTEYPVIIASKAFTSYTELCKVIMVGDSTNGLGIGQYYTMANDMNATYYHYWNDGSTDLWSAWGSGDNAFKGTLDGCGHTINGGTAGGPGLFGHLNGAVIKNINFMNVTLNDGATLFGSFIQSTTLENINVTLVQNNPNQTGNGVFAIQGAMNCTLKNITVTASGCDLYSIFGTVDNGVHNSGSTYENIVVNAKSLVMVCGGKTTVEGVTLNLGV